MAGRIECSNELLIGVMTDDCVSVDRFLKRGINPTSITQTGLTLMGLASRQGSINVLRQLLEYCENPSKHICVDNDLEYHDLTPEGMNDLQWDDEIITNSLDNTTTNPSSTTIDNEWTTLFLYYIKIIEKTQQYLTCSSTSSTSAATAATTTNTINSSSSYTSKIKLDPNILDNHSLSPLHHAAINGHLDCVQLLLNFGCSANIETSDGYTALHLAGDHKDIIELLLKNNGNPNKFSYVKLETPLMFAAKKGDIELIELLLKYGANINALNYLDQSVVILSVIHDQYESVRVLIKNKCRLNEIDSNGFSSISYAIKYKNKNILKLLLESGARLHPISNTLQKYLRNGSIDIVKILIESGINPNIRSNEMWTPLHVAIKYCTFDIVEFLIYIGNAKLGQSLYNDFKEIHLLMTRKFDSYNFIKIFNLLVSQCIDFDDLSEIHKKSPLEIALNLNNFHVFALLVLEGCNINLLPAPDTIDYLKRYNFFQLINLLILAGYKNFQLKIPLTLKQLSRIKIRNLLVAKLKGDQKHNRLLKVIKNNSYLETYVDKMFIPISLKLYLVKFPDIDLEFESNYWPLSPVDNFHFNLRVD